ncbi:TPA: conjugal transfer protein TraJ, partial [Escherichia coli]|nr:conjugal transfer protein TraJ [Escherichia coli]
MTEQVKTTRKHGKHIRVPVLPEEEAIIKRNADAAGLSTAAFLRKVGMGYEVE